MAGTTDFQNQWGMPPKCFNLKIRPSLKTVTPDTKRNATKQKCHILIISSYLYIFLPIFLLKHLQFISFFLFSASSKQACHPIQPLSQNPPLCVR